VSEGVVSKKGREQVGDSQKEGEETSEGKGKDKGKGKGREGAYPLIPILMVMMGEAWEGAVVIREGGKCCWGWRIRKEKKEKKKDS
jgi:hypothetical protein